MERTFSLTWEVASKNNLFKIIVSEAFIISGLFSVHISLNNKSAKNFGYPFKCLFLITFFI